MADISYLNNLITPKLLSLVVEVWLPLSKTDPIIFGESIQKNFWEAGDNTPKVRPAVWPVLKALSEIGLDNIPDLMVFLPSVESSDFPEQALGLQLLLDQAPRLLCRGVDARWTYGYFEEISVGLTLKLAALPPDMRPSSWSRWKGSASFEYFVWVRTQLGAPFAHHERYGEANVAFSEETRMLVEEHCGVRDPHRDQPESEKRWDLHSFPRLIRERGPPRSCGTAEGAFWLTCLMDAHKPPLDKYGRYPYRNGWLGRVNTPAEDEWMMKTENFAAAPKEVSDKIREDVENGVWTPLGDGSGGT
ncbi:hypothetical protein F5Y15DRAFT_398460 [Xylariaceae sp. FL0016]|nr:hypothetical protein F5Y15DRAFT_398460 [Xylariaceae sp. FL0016]